MLLLRFTDRGGGIAMLEILIFLWLIITVCLIVAIIALARLLTDFIVDWWWS